MKRALTGLALVLLATIVLLQFVPEPRTNPPVTREVRWDAPATRALAARACFDCHSNATKWPWYSHVAPVSFFVIGDVTDGRGRLNFSEWDQPQRVGYSSIEDAVTHGDMPLRQYVFAHPEAKLTPAETAQLLAGLRATLLQDPPIRQPR